MSVSAWYSTYVLVHATIVRLLLIVLWYKGIPKQETKSYGEMAISGILTYLASLYARNVDDD